MWVCCYLGSACLWQCSALFIWSGSKASSTMTTSTLPFPPSLLLLLLPPLAGRAENTCWKLCNFHRLMIICVIRLIHYLRRRRKFSSNYMMMRLRSSQQEAIGQTWLVMSGIIEQTEPKGQHISKYGDHRNSIFISISRVFCAELCRRASTLNCCGKVVTLCQFDCVYLLSSAALTLHCGRCGPSSLLSSSSHSSWVSSCSSLCLAE